MVKIVIVTPKTPHGLVESIGSTGYRVEVKPTPECEPGVVNIVKPGTRVPARGECCVIDAIPHLWMIPDVLAMIPQEELCPLPESLVHRVALERLRLLRDNYEPAWRDAPYAPPRRPPPIHVVAEVYHEADTEATVERARTLLSAGADAVSLGLRERARGWVWDEYLEAVATLSRDAPVYADPGWLEGMIHALEAGATVGMSVTPGDLALLPRWVREEKALVLLAWDVEEALEAERGYGGKLILDPVVTPLISPGMLGSLQRLASLARGSRSPLLAGVNNVYELLDADTTGSIPVLVALAAEAGASIVLVTEESWKAQGAVAEARIAADLVSLSLYYRSPPKDYPLRLLVAKDKRPEPPPTE